MSSLATTLPLARRLIGRYLMFGLAGVFTCISLFIALRWYDNVADYLPVVAAVALLLLLTGAFVLHRSVGANQAIESQLHRIARLTSSEPLPMEPLAEADVAAVGWNSLVRHFRDQHVVRSLEARLGSLAGTVDDKRWNLIFQALHEGIAVVDHEGSIEMANNAFTALLGLESSDHAVGKSMIEILETSIPKAASQLDNTNVGNSAFLSCELRKGSSLADGVLRLQRTPIIDAESENRAALWTLRDITQQRLAEEMRNQFVFTATHELRTPLANIKAYAETLAQTDDIDIQDQKKFYNIINNEATRLSRFVNELLNVSQMESGAVAIILGEIDVERMIGEVVENLRPQIHQKQLEFESHFPAKFPKLKLDKDKIAAALVNLLGNAVKYTPEKGVVRFLVEVSETHVHFHVEDTGIGIAADELPRISEKFFRSSDSRVQEITGSGLGLAFSQEVARLHRGKIEVKSELNKGSRFTLTLPLI